MKFGLQNKFVCVFIIVFITFLIYSNSLKNEYNMDDSLVMTNTSLVNGNFIDVFTQYSFTVEEGSFDYRPVSVATFYIENKIFGQKAAISHFINLLLYAILGILIYYFLIFIEVQYATALLITILFMVFPLHTEVVDNVKNRDEILASIFGFSSLLVVLTSINKPNSKSLVFVVLFVILGMLSKSSFLIFTVFIVLIPLVLIKRSKHNFEIKKALKYFFIAAIGVLIVLIFKYYVFKESHAIRVVEYFENPLYFSTIIERILPSIYCIGFYLKLMVIPFNPSYYYGYNTVNFTNVYSIYSLIGISFILIIPVLIFFLIKNHKQGLLPIIIGLILIYINIIAVSNLLKPLPGIVAERFIFNGSLGFIIVLIFIMQELLNQVVPKQKNMVLTVSSMAIIVSYGNASFARNSDWKSEIILYKNDIYCVSNSAKANEMLANKYLSLAVKNKDRKFLNLSEHYFKRAVLIYPSYSACYNNLGYICYLKNNFSKAIDYYKESAQLSNKPLVYFNIAKCYEKLSNVDLANSAYKKALMIQPNLNQLASVYKEFVLSNYLTNDAIIFLENIILTTSNNQTSIHLLLIDFYNENKNYSGMLIHLKRVFELTNDEKYKQYINIIEKNQESQATFSN